MEADGMAEKPAEAEVAFDSSNTKTGIVVKCAFLSKVGMVPMNPNKVNQDQQWIIENYNNDPTQCYVGVADGHGSLGHEVSGFIKRKLPIYLAREPNLKTDPKDALAKAYLRTNQDISSSPLDVTFSGSTLVSVFLRGSSLWCANVGDSRAIVGRRKGNNWVSVKLSDDHKPDRPDEERRIIANNGRVEAFKGPNGENLGPARVWLKSQDAPGLAMSRSMGDSVAASVGVIAEPETLTMQLTSDDKFLVVASDGVWEFLDNDDVVRIVTPYYLKGDAKGAATELVKISNQKWREEEEVIDDTTCVILFLNVP